MIQKTFKFYLRQFVILRQTRKGLKNVVQTKHGIKVSLSEGFPCLQFCLLEPNKKTPFDSPKKN